MLTLWLAAGFLAQAGSAPAAAVSAGGWGDSFDSYRASRRATKLAELRESTEAARRLRAEAERQAREALEAFDIAEREAYIVRLNELVAAYSPKMLQVPDISGVAARIVAALVSELEAEFDRLIARMQFERDEEEAVIALLLAA